MSYQLWRRLQRWFVILGAHHDAFGIDGGHAGDASCGFDDRASDECHYGGNAGLFHVHDNGCVPGRYVSRFRRRNKAGFGFSKPR